MLAYPLWGYGAAPKLSRVKADEIAQMRRTLPHRYRVVRVDVTAAHSLTVQDLEGSSIPQISRAADKYDIRTVSAVIGHKHTSTTLEVYAHLLPNATAVAVGHIARRLVR